MEDHTNTCRLATTAAFTRGMPNFPVEPARPAVFNNVTVYHAQPYSHRDPLGNVVEPGLVVDTTDLVGRKQAMLAKHASQKLWLDESQGVNSYLDALAELDAELGRMSCLFQYAEGWRRHLHLGFCGPEDNPLRTALKDRILLMKPPGERRTPAV
jgi:LmbE family N-acetylglucosaminyl deacetylase